LSKPIDVPKSFIERTSVFDTPAHSFIDIYNERPAQGFRINPLKQPPASFLSNFKRIPWEKNGFYYEEEKLGHHPYHHAGAFYIQEPSAMAVVNVMDIEPHHVVLDVSAAPGGKSTHIASLLSNEGLLISNEIDSTRFQSLLSNIERMGISNTVVTNQSPKDLVTHLPQMFDRILVDAPCSGEGLFRKDPSSRLQWSLALVESCAIRQKEILETVFDRLKPGGILVYSTCTFSREENEQVILDFLAKHNDFELYQHPIFAHFNTKVTQGVGAKILPNEVRGEGHYLAVLRRQGSVVPKSFKPWRGNTRSAIFNQFVQEFLKDVTLPFTFQHKNLFYGLPHMEEFRRLHIVRAGILLGEFSDTRFTPAHHFSHVLGPQHVQRVLALELKDDRVLRYLKGEELAVENIEDGWTLVTVDHLSLGWGKVSKGRLKNHYPKGLRLI
jgi:NOL1/NOP2/sun family putative RNA methylase